ncbi:chaplin [Streptomyces sp. GS7]|uniref:chaplin n=1 Tax=Streptomyces sp. GS7 TaxID=2692234 RepID=UPI0013191787|nr:chaplin [Streptomyces sp. GS7]QHC21861.1 DUF320 domain-containing protein [Streptomyces sp. GS7]
MKNIKRVAAITMASAGLALAGAGVASADAPQSQGVTAGSPGVVSGNLIQSPADTPVNTCGNTASVVGLFNPASGNTCHND